MKKNLLFVGMVLMALCLSFSAMAQAQGNGPVTLAAKPAGMSFDQANYLVVQPANTPSVLKFQYHDKGFPAGTQTSYNEVTTSNGNMVTIKYLVPGGQWTTLSWEQLKCKDEQCLDEPEPEPKHVREKFVCDPGRAIGMGVLGGGIGFGLGSITSTADAGNAHAEVKANPWVGLAVGAIAVSSVDCLVQYWQWKKANR